MVGGAIIFAPRPCSSAYKASRSFTQINADAAPRNIRRGQSSVIGLSKVNHNVTAGYHGKHWWIEEITQYLEPQDVAIVFRGGDNIGSDKVRTNRLALRFRFDLQLGHRAPHAATFRFSGPRVRKRAVRRNPEPLWVELVPRCPAPERLRGWSWKARCISCFAREYCSKLRGGAWFRRVP